MYKKFHIYKTFSVDDDERKSFYKICAKTNARIVAMEPSKCHLGWRTPSSYTLQFRDKKSSEKFSKLLQKKSISDRLLTNIWALSAVSGLTCALLSFMGVVLVKNLKNKDEQPTPQIQKITDQKKIPVQDTSRGARTE